MGSCTLVANLRQLQAALVQVVVDVAPKRLKKRIFLLEEAPVIQGM